MRHTLGNLAFCFATAVAALAAPEATKPFSVKGTIKGLDAQPLQLRIWDEGLPEGARTIKSKAVGGRIEFIGTLPRMARCSLYIQGLPKLQKSVGDGFIPTPVTSFNFFLFPGANVTLKGEITDFVDAYASGDSANDQYSTLLAEIHPKLNVIANNSVRLKTDASADKAALNQQSSALAREVQEAKLAFIREHLDNPIAMWLLDDMALRSQVKPDEAEKLFLAFGDRHVDTPWRAELKQRIHGFKASKNGNPVPDVISSETLDGKPFDLKSLRGKVVILDFWGTWCGPCISGMPKMKEARAKYKDRLEIVGIACDEYSKDYWISTVKKLGLEWPQIFNIKGANNFVTLFNVTAFPTKFIVDEKGVIRERFRGESEDFYKAIDKMMQP